MVTKQTTKPKPPAPAQLPSKEEVAARLPLPRTQDDEEQESTTVDQIRDDLRDASESLSAAWEKLDDLETEQG